LDPCHYIFSSSLICHYNSSYWNPAIAISQISVTRHYIPLTMFFKIYGPNYPRPFSSSSHHPLSVPLYLRGQIPSVRVAARPQRLRHRFPLLTAGGASARCTRSAPSASSHGSAASSSAASRRYSEAWPWSTSCSWAWSTTSAWWTCWACRRLREQGRWVHALVAARSCGSGRRGGQEQRLRRRGDGRGSSSWGGDRLKMATRTRNLPLGQIPFAAVPGPCGFVPLCPPPPQSPAPSPQPMCHRTRAAADGPQLAPARC